MAQSSAPTASMATLDAVASTKVEVHGNVGANPNEVAVADCDDGTEVVTSAHEEEFLAWLRENGAQIDKLDWPSRATISGVRGAVAVVDIEPNEPMLEIPQSLMIYPSVCFGCAALQPVYQAKWHFFTADDDLVIAVFLMHERLRGKDSFWHPYLQILPVPGGIGEWSHQEQLELQDREIVGEARRRPASLERLYLQAAEAFETAGLNLGDYSLELFKWAWMVIQSRAFGRRLPWTAMVPFADCLNHANVPVKYDLTSRPSIYAATLKEKKNKLESISSATQTISKDHEPSQHQNSVKGDAQNDGCEERSQAREAEQTPNLKTKVGQEEETAGSNSTCKTSAHPAVENSISAGLASMELKEEVCALNNDSLQCQEACFRLFPSGSNRYGAGEEAFNSYGRRSNSFLLLEYGFCLENNEWDSYKIHVRMEPDVPEYDAKSDFLRSLGMTRFRSFRLEPFCKSTSKTPQVHPELLAFLRFSWLTSEEFHALQTRVRDPISQNPDSSMSQFVPFSSRNTGMTLDSILPKDSVSVETELTALDDLVDLLEAELEQQSTSLEQDLATLEVDPSIPPRLRAAMIYRIARKEILETHLHLAKKILDDNDDDESADADGEDETNDEKDEADAELE